MTPFTSAPPFAVVIPRDEAETYWQPAPSHGTMNTILSPKNCPSNAFSVATQYIDAGCEIRSHAHERIEEILFLYEGHGTLMLEGRNIPVREGSMCLVGRYVRHRLDNESGRLMKVLVVALPPGIEEGRSTPPRISPRPVAALASRSPDLPRAGDGVETATFCLASRRGAARNSLDLAVAGALP